ncbi:MAG TPA: hypothetical protein ENF89_00920 [Candidatus Bathyarchaeota archaeon]|nr:hypothetical protein [Candidatus Bathyarchaeota archaeon]
MIEDYSWSMKSPLNPTYIMMSYEGLSREALRPLSDLEAQLINYLEKAMGILGMPSGPSGRP